MDELTDHSLKLSNKVRFDTSTQNKSDFDGSESSNSSEKSCSSTHYIVRDTMRDIIDLQQCAIQQAKETAEQQKLNYVLKATYDEIIRKYESEKLDNEKTKILLQKETEKLQFALGEIEILTTHLEKEKKSHDALIKSATQKASREFQRSDLLYEKCREKDDIIQRQSDDICLKNNEILNLKERLKSQKDTHRQLLDDIELQKVQQEYLTRSLGERENRKRRGVS